MKYAIGEAIQIVWSDDDPRYEYVRGHVSDEDAREALKSIGYEGLEEAPTRQTWARWIPSTRTDIDSLFFHAEPDAPGAFAVTDVSVR